MIIDMRTRYIYMCTDGAVAQKVDTGYARSITDNIYRDASKGNYYECASKAFAQVDRLIAGKHISQPMKHITNFFLAVMIALAINFAWISYWANKTRPKPKEILANADKGFRVNRPRTSRTYYTKESSSRSGAFNPDDIYSEDYEFFDYDDGGGFRYSGGRRSGGGHRF